MQFFVIGSVCMKIIFILFFQIAICLWEGAVELHPTLFFVSLVPPVLFPFVFAAFIFARQARSRRLRVAQAGHLKQLSECVHDVTQNSDSKGDAHSEIAHARVHSIICDVQI